MDILRELYSVIQDRKEHPVEGSYTNYLFDKGTDKISKKLGEEAVEVVIAASQRDRKATIQEIADLEYHLLVLMADRGITLDDVETERVHPVRKCVCVCDEKCDRCRVGCNAHDTPLSNVSFTPYHTWAQAAVPNL